MKKIRIVKAMTTHEALAADLTNHFMAELCISENTAASIANATPMLAIELTDRDKFGRFRLKPNDGLHAFTLGIKTFREIQLMEKYSGKKAV